MFYIFVLIKYKNSSNIFKKFLPYSPSNNPCFSNTKAGEAQMAAQNLFSNFYFFNFLIKIYDSANNFAFIKPPGKAIKSKFESAQSSIYESAYIIMFRDPLIKRLF